MNLTMNKTFSIILTILGFIFLFYLFNNNLSSQQLTLLLKNAGIFAPLLFILIQIIQCVIPIIPGSVSCIIGVALFNPIGGFIYNFIGISIGSTINFLLAKKYGNKIVLKLVSKNNYDKYIVWLEKRDKFNKLFALAMLLPCLPDDLLCFLAGLTPMSFKKFVLIILICKPWSILAYSIGLDIITSWLKAFF